MPKDTICTNRGCINSPLNWYCTRFCDNCQPSRTRSRMATPRAPASGAARRQRAPSERARAKMIAHVAADVLRSASPQQPSTPWASPLSRMPEVVQHALVSLTPVPRPSMALPPIASPSPFVDKPYVSSVTPIGLVLQWPASPAPTPAAPFTALSGWASLAGSPVGNPACDSGSPAGNLFSLFVAEMSSTPFGSHY